MASSRTDRRLPTLEFLENKKMLKVLKSLLFLTTKVDLEMDLSVLIYGGRCGVRKGGEVVKWQKVAGNVKIGIRIHGISRLLF